MVKIIKKGDEWDAVVKATKGYDFYHLYSYHRLAEKNGEGEPFLFVYREGERFAAVPFLMRAVSQVKGLETAGEGLFDVTSVYGYPGPLANSDKKEEVFFRQFSLHLHQFFAEHSVVTAFTRLHPVLGNHVFFKEGELIQLGKTVSIDLSLPLEEQRKQFRKNHIRNISKAYKNGVKVFIDEEWKHLDAFLDIYALTMDKVRASQYYYFDREYFFSLRDGLGESLKLFTAEYGGKIISAGLFTVTGAMAQYHLGGTLPEYLKLSAFTCIIDEARAHAADQGAAIFHLGGGLGSKEDSLFHFKAGFSDRKHDFYIWKFIVNSQKYAQLKQIKEKWNKENQFKYLNENYFPIYRSETDLMGR